MAEITIRPMWKKELAAVCQCTMYELNKRLTAFAKEKKWTKKDWYGKVQLQKEQVRDFLAHNDILPETITV